jgi:tRNA-Thr(GGU) m(6)t(6)A37 methyltransferase TsaA
MTVKQGAMRPGEVALGFDPAERAAAGVVFIGRLRTPWVPGECPKSLRAARELGNDARIEIDAPYRGGLEGLAPGMALVVLYWLDRGRRDLIRQAPRHRESPAGVFALRSPVRPNPIGLAVVRCTGLDLEAGLVAVDALDAYDGTPLLDLKPWLPTVDIPPEPAG